MLARTVLLSHFDQWHTVLNANVAIPKLPGESEDEFEKRWDLVYDDFNARLRAAGVGNIPVPLWPTELRAEAGRDVQ